ncbi:hypothetical protein RB201_11765 [Streptomyces sp. S1A(2023)]
MRIAYLHGGGMPSPFANGVHVMRMCDAFAAAGHEVTLYSMPGSDEDPYTYYGVRHRFSDPPRRLSRLHALRLLEARRGHPDTHCGRPHPGSRLRAGPLRPGRPQERGAPGVRDPSTA